MAKVGLRGLMAGKLDEENNAYTEAKSIGKAINANININSNNVKLYAEDSVAESDQSFKDGKINIGVDDLSTEMNGMLLGHEVGEDGELIANSSDIAPYAGVGFYSVLKKNNKAKYRAIFLHKVQFAELNDESETKGETVSFKTPSIEGTIMTDSDGNWKSEKTFEDEKEAIEYIKAKFSSTEATETEATETETE